jgi:hypothetical protein
MADSIPRAYLKELTDTLAGESLKLAFFVNLTGYNELTATTYTILATTATEVSDGSYATGGYVMTVASSNLATNGAIVTATEKSFQNKTFTFRYLVMYNNTTKKIRFVKDLLGDRQATGAVIKITWNATNGMIKLAFNG